MTTPAEQTDQTEREERQDAGPIGMERLAAEGDEDLAKDSDGREKSYEDRRVPEEPEEVLPEDRVAALGGIVRMTLRLSRGVARTKTEEGAGDEKRTRLFARITAALKNVIAELAAQKRYRDCEEEAKKPWYRGRWFVHMSIMWGFIGLGVATGLDYLLMIVAD